VTASAARREPAAVEDTDAVNVRSSEMLGFAADARVLIVNCDDLGMYPAINAAVLESIIDGIATSCSLMVPCPAAADAMRLLAAHPEIPFGIHLTLVCDSTRYRWGPVSGKHLVPTLLDGTGDFFVNDRRAELLARARLEEVEVEARAQIDAVLDAGLTPMHLDWHCLADGGRDDLGDLTVALAAEYGLAARVWLEPRTGRMRRRGLPVVDHPFLDSFGLEVDAKAERYAQLLRDLPAGLSEWAVHPSLGTEESRAIDPGWRVRRTDYEFLISASARAVVDQEGITLIDYRTVRSAWLR
jgi:chitin disaccharide deacetylase